MESDRDDSDNGWLGSDIDSQSESDADEGTRSGPIKPNDPYIIAKTFVQAHRGLAGVCNARCYVCDSILNERARRRLDLSKLQEEDRTAIQTLLEDLVVVPGQFDLCPTCKSYVMKKKVPLSAAKNGFRYPEYPPGLKPLTEVEEHILALRLPFQQIVHLGRMGSRGQFGVIGSVINVPTDAPDTVRKVIPLLPEEDELCVVNIKRKLAHRRAFASSFVNRENIIAWGRFLQNSTLYKEHGAVFDESRLGESSTEEAAEPRCSGDGDVFYGLPDEPESREEMFRRLGGIQHTLLMEDRARPVRGNPEPLPATGRADPATDVVDVAPGEDKTPISVVRDRRAEELSFPGIYLGEARSFTNYVTRYRAMRSEIRRFDRRAARPQNVLYKYNVHMREQASSRLRHKFKRGAKKTLGMDITREQLLDENFIATSQKKGIAMPCLLPNSAEYWRGRSHDLFAMVRQVGKPHLFLTLSAAEYHWPTLIDVLRRIHEAHGETDRFNVTNLETNVSLPKTVSAQAMDAIDELVEQEKSGEDTVPNERKLQLIRDDPIVCAIYFREVVLQLKKHSRKNKMGPMAKYFLTDWFLRIEFQVSYIITRLPF